METNKKNYEIVDGVEKLEAALARARAAQKIFRRKTGSRARQSQSGTEDLCHLHAGTG